MDVFKGEKKERVERPSLERAHVVLNPLTKIPKHLTEINVFPSLLKGGKVAVTEANADSAFRTFLKDQSSLLGIEVGNLKLTSAKKIRDNWYAKYKQYYKGIPVHESIVSLEADVKGKVSSYSSNYQPDIDVPTTPVVTVEKAVEIAKGTYNKRVAARLAEKDAELIVYPTEIEGKMKYYLAWKFMLAPEEPNPDLEKYFVIDAIEGKIISSYPVRFPGATVSGRVQCEIYPANPTDAVSTVPCRNETVNVEDAGDAVTNSSGDYSKYVSVWWVISDTFFDSKECIFRLQGPYAQVQNSNGANYEERRNCSANDPCNLTWTATDRDHINVFYHMNLYHDFLRDQLGHSWTNSWTGSSRFNARVNYTFANAYAGDPLQFGTANFARSSDVIYHECTHNVLYSIYDNWIGFPQTYKEGYAMDEGFSDYFSCSFTNDSRHGEGYGGTRDLNNTMKYAGKSSYNSEGHTGGMIIAGAAWDLRSRLIASLGAAGARVADSLILEAHQILSNSPRDYYFSDPNESNFLLALYKAADDNNNLLDSFPYFIDIQRSFHNHDLLQAVLKSSSSFDFSTNRLGSFTGGDLYYYQGKFWANNVGQRGVKDLGDIGNVALESVGVFYPSTDFTRQGVSAVAGHTYISLAQQGEEGNVIVFRVDAISADKSNVTIRYLYRRRFFIVISGYIFNYFQASAGKYIKGDFRFADGKFFGDREEQIGLIDLGDIKEKDIEKVEIPPRGYESKGIPVVKGHTYVSLSKFGVKKNCVVFRVNEIERNNVSIEVFNQKVL